MTTKRFAARLKVLEGNHGADIALLRRLRAMTDDELDAELRYGLAAAGFDLAAMHWAENLSVEGGPIPGHRKSVAE